MNGSIIRELVSVVVPVFNEVESLKELYRQISNTFEDASFNYEVIFVDDGSNDGSVEIEETIAKSNKNVTVLQFQRNYGKAAALSKGFKYARGEFVATLDADLQDDPKAIPKMIELIKKEKYDLVSGWKQNRQDRFIKKHTSKIFNLVTRIMTGIPLHDMNNGLKVYKSEVVKTISVYGEMHRFIPVLAKMDGFKSGEIKVRHFPRKFGKTKYGISRFYKGFLDLLTVLFTSKFLRRPMHFFGLWGIIFFGVGTIAEIYLLVMKFAFGEPFQKHIALLILGVLLIVFGMQFLSLGLISEMIAYHQKSKKQ